MKEMFITENFLLETGEARELFHDYAKEMPILDYHSHLPAGDIAGDRKFENLIQIWLAGDHYKWRAMRANGIPERFITGNATDLEKFEKWAETVPKTLRNPLYHWTHLELKIFFGIQGRLLGPDTAKSIWEECNEKLSGDELSCRSILKRMNVTALCTTDDPCDSLEHHRAIAADPSFEIKVLPAFRPDKALAVESPETFNAWVNRLAKAADVDIKDFSSFLEALQKRCEFFRETGCGLADHGLDTVFAEDYTHVEITRIFNKAREGKKLDPPEIKKYKSALLYELAVLNHEMGWVQQFHIGALRNNNTRMLQTIGPDAGFDSMGDFNYARPLAKFLDRLDYNRALSKTVLYNHNPKDNEMLATMAGNFQDGETPGKIQFGPAWWYLDQKDGMERQIEVLSNMGVLGRFIGMTTDSRSFLSYSRHEYFRRILCNILGGDMAKGLIPRDMDLAGGMVRDICYHNALQYFDFEV